MARGNVILLTPDRAHKQEGIIGSGLTPKPGTVMQNDYSQAKQGERYVWKLYDADADGGRPKSEIIILDMDKFQGRDATTAYAEGERAFGFTPLPGCRFNGLKGDVSGTGDDFAKGDILIIDDTTGKFILTTGTPETEVSVCEETVTDPTTDQLVEMTWTGY